MATISQMIEQVMAHMDGRPAFEVMRADETARGNEIVVPGETSWLPSEDWDPTIVVSRSGKEIRLIAILALNPGRGAFRRTLAGIMSAGLTPVVIAPTSLMRSTLKRWGWFPRHIGKGWDHEEQWRPRKDWQALKATICAETGKWVDAPPPPQDAAWLSRLSRTPITKEAKNG